MNPELTTHTLLRIRDEHCLIADAQPPAQRPEWVDPALKRAPWVVIRRAPATDTRLPVGVRGRLRHERWAAWLPEAAILERVTPQTLAHQRAWLRATRRESIAALDALEAVAKIMSAHGLEGLWGPTGSVGFELASAWPSAHTNSDLDLCVQLPGPPLIPLARSLHRQLTTLAVRCDVLLETPPGAIALAEYALQTGSCVLRTTEGPRLYPSPSSQRELPSAVQVARNDSVDVW